MADGWLETSFDLHGKRVFIAGHGGMVGSALVRCLAGEGGEILTAPRRDLDLRDQAAVQAWMRVNKPDVVVLAAAKVGGILANDTQPADFLYDNLMIEANVIRAAHECGVQKLVFLGSSCIYPKEAAVPITPDALMSAPLEPTNEAYAVAKIAGIKLCQAYRKQYGRDFISVMPCNLYGPGDRFDAQASHVIPALMMKAHAAKEAGAKALEVWGSGKPLREFLHVDDLADAVCFALKNYSSAAPLNIGSGEEVSIKGLAEQIADVTGFKGRLVFNLDKPDGTMRKVMDSSALFNQGWRPKVSLKGGLFETYAWYRNEILRINKAA